MLLVAVGVEDQAHRDAQPRITTHDVFSGAEEIGAVAREAIGTISPASSSVRCAASIGLATSPPPPAPPR
eukprot:scaffold19696_cov128-Isochrysis_galbana.AAC.2